MTLHVTNGESVAATLWQTELGGDVLAWRDALHEGPLGSRELRADFLARCGFGSYYGILSDLVARDYALQGAEHIVLWFEHDLYDQLQLVQILAQRPTNAELIQADTYLGSLVPPELEALWPGRRPVTEEQLDLGAEVWDALVAGEIPLDRDLSALPYLDPALRRFAEEPDRTERQLLEILGEGPRTWPEIFRENGEREEAQFAGDVWIRRRLDGLVGLGLVVDDGERLRLA